jgi:phosphoglycerate dehydrogenase-like enzyme
MVATRRILYLPKTSLSRDILSDRARITLSELGEVAWNEMDRDYTPEELVDLLPGVDAVVTSWGVPGFTDEMLAAADCLKIVGHAAGSVKNRLPQAGYERGIVVLSAAAVIADPVAEYTLWAMLSMQRDLYRYDGSMKVERTWPHGNQGFAHELYYKRVGIVSAGLVGRRVIELLKPFHCDVMVYDPYLSEDQAGLLGVRTVSLEELVATSDIVSIHAPTIPATKELIGQAHFTAMKDGALFINTARAWIVDQSAMKAELATGRIRAVLDVFDKEPLAAEDELRAMDNVFLSPHVSGHTEESRRRLVEAVADDMRRFFAGEPLRLAVTWDRLKIMA